MVLICDASITCNIAELSLENNKIDDECIDMLTSSLVKNSTLQSLNLGLNKSVTPLLAGKLSSWRCKVLIRIWPD